MKHWRKLDHPERRTFAFGAMAVFTAFVAIIHDVLRLRRGNKARAESLLEEAQTAVHEAQQAVHNRVEGVRAEVAERAYEARQGYQHLSHHDTTLFHFLVSFLIASLSSRGIAYRLRSRTSVGPFRNAGVGGVHVHHYIPGIILIAVSGSASLLSTKNHTQSLLAIPFGAGLGMTLDESALLLRLEDVYWRREGLLGIQISIGVLGLLALCILARALNGIHNPQIWPRPLVGRQAGDPREVQYAYSSSRTPGDDSSTSS